MRANELAGKVAMEVSGLADARLAGNDDLVGEGSSHGGNCCIDDGKCQFSSVLRGGKTDISRRLVPIVNTMSLPTLYTTDKAGKERQWTVTVKGDTVTKKHGIVGGKLVTAVRVYEGVNKGRANETTAKQQAQLQAKRDWVAQLDKRYKPKGKCAMYDEAMAAKKKAGGTNHAASSVAGTAARKAPKVLSVANGMAPSVEKDVIPMKCQVWDPEEKMEKHFDMVVKGVFVQPKLDGIRCTARVQSDGTVVLLSNSSKQLIWHTSLRTKIKKLLGDSDITLDGELYAHSLRDGDRELDHVERFGVITGACRPVRGEPSPYEEQIGYHVFDMVDETLTQAERREKLTELFVAWADPRVTLVETMLFKGSHATVKKSIDKYHMQCIQAGYEGVIIRAHDLMYKTKHRSLKMRKLKSFDDAEFRVTGVELDSGVGAENFVWVCVTDDGETFKAKPEGSHKAKLQWYKNAAKKVGKLLTVKYQGVSADGVPRFPIGKGFRDVSDLVGEPVGDADTYLPFADDDE